MYDIKKFKSFQNFKKRFLIKLPKNYKDPEMENHCWNWQGAKNKDGYGLIKWGGITYNAHRISYIIFKKLIPINKHIRHTCNNPSCINPKHLILGTASDNIIDMIKINIRCNQKLNEEAVKVIKWMLKYKYEKELIQKLANLYKVSKTTIYDIKSNRTWYWMGI